MAPLSDIKVIDFSHMIAGPFATFYLSQLGAKVTKFEAPGTGDLMRHMSVGSSAFACLNSGKNLEQIDIKTKAGRDSVLTLAAEADVFVDNYRPGVLERRGMGYAAVRAVNPRIIYCAVSGYGHSSGGLAERGAYDHVIQGLTGMSMIAGSEDDPPIKTGFPVVDTATGIIGALAIVSALRDRDRTGEGCMLDISMWACALQLMYPLVCGVLNSGTIVKRVGNQGYSGSPAADIFRCRDGWISIGANTNRQLAALKSALGIAPDFLNQDLNAEVPGQVGAVQCRDPAALKLALRDAIGCTSAAELETRLNEAKVPAARVRHVHEFVQEFRDLGLLQPLELDGGSTLSPGLGWRVIKAQNPAVELGVAIPDV